MGLLFTIHRVGRLILAMSVCLSCVRACDYCYLGGREDADHGGNRGAGACVRRSVIRTSAEDLVIYCHTAVVVVVTFIKGSLLR